METHSIHNTHNQRAVWLSLTVLLCLWTTHAAPRERLPVRSVARLQEYAERNNLQSIYTDLTAILQPRVPDTPSHTQVRFYIQHELLKLRWHVETDEFHAETPVGRRQFANIVATHNPNAPRRLVVAAHYDTKYFPDGSRFVGATDSALPCALLLDLARSLEKDLDASLEAHDSDISLELIFFDGEEAFEKWSRTDSLYGSRHLATRFQSELLYDRPRIESIELLVLLDLLGSKGSTVYPPAGPNRKFHLQLGRIEAAIRKHTRLATNLPSLIFRADSVAPSIEDDHIPFAALDVPVLHAIAFPFPHFWHTSSDDIGVLHNDTIVLLASVFRYFVADRLSL